MRLPPAGVTLGISTALTGLALDKEQTDLPAAPMLLDGIGLAMLNLLLVGPMMHAVAMKFTTMRRRVWRVWSDAAAIVGLHSALYAVAHRAMHRVAALRPIHAAHHAFNETVVPTIANAVSTHEFVFAYMAPFMAAVWLLRPCATSLNAAVAVVSTFNLLVHAPHLAPRPWPWWLVRPREHLEHHRVRSRTYAAPTIAWRRVLGRLRGRRIDEGSAPA